MCVIKAHIALLILNLSNGVKWSASHPSCFMQDTRPQYPLNWSHRNTMIFYITGVHKQSRIFSMELDSCHLLAPNILRCLLHFWKLCAPLLYGYMRFKVHCSFTVGQTWQNTTVTAPYLVQHDTTDSALMADELAR